MKKERKHQLRELAKLMNRQQGTPLPITGHLLDCFDLVITSEEADYLLKMGTEPMSHAEAAALSDMSPAAFGSFFGELLKKGLVWPKRNARGEERFSLAPILLGWFELQLCRGEETPREKEFARRFDRLFAFWGRLNIPPVRFLLNHKIRRHPKPQQSIAAISEDRKGKRVIPVNRTLENQENRIWPPHSINELIEKYGDENAIAVAHCFCRQWRKMAGDPCRFRYPSESCLVIGEFTEHTVRYGFGRYISKADALSLIAKVQKAGAIHSVFYEKDDFRRPRIAICNCCWDCCGILGSYNRGIIPLQVRACYVARLGDAELCKGCGKCEKFCPVEAVRMHDQKPILNSDQCIGCGQCAFQCPEHCFTLAHADRTVVLPLQSKSRARIA